MLTRLRLLRDLIARPRSALLFGVAVAILSSGCKRKDDASFDRLMNLGKAYLENRDSKHALEALVKAVELKPKSAPAWRNLARAQRLARRYAEAEATLRRVAKIEPESAATNYLMGLALASQSRFAEAVPFFEEAVRLDPNEAALRFQLAGAYEVVGRRDKAVEQLHETVRLDPLHASAHFKLAGLARQSGDRAEMERRQRKFVRLRRLFGDNTRTGEALELCRYTEPESIPPEKPADVAPPIPVRFVDISDTAFTSDADRGATAACVIDVDAAGHSIFFVVGTNGGVRLMQAGASGAMESAPARVEPPLPPDARFDSCLVGNFHDDVPPGVKYDPKVHAANDVLLLGAAGLRLLQRTGPGTFADATDKAGLSGVVARSSVWVDYEHDGDLDLLLARDRGVELWQNNGDATFVNVTETVGLASDVSTSGATDVAAIDLDGNIAVDFIVAGGSEPTRVFLNQRAGRFAPMPEPPGPWPVAKRVLTNDLNNDGHADVVLLRRDEVELLYGRTSIRRRIALAGVELPAGGFVDFDNDGRLDLVLAGSGNHPGRDASLHLFRNAVGDVWDDASTSSGLSAIPGADVTRILPADVDLDGDTDLVLVGGGRLRLLRNDGGNANGQFKIRFTTVKTNTTGLGTLLELHDGAWKVSRTVTSLPIEIGFGKHQRFDAVHTTWTNGVVDNQIDVKPATTTLMLTEKNVAAGSCPFLYVWDGTRFRFVTDLLGNAPIGLPLTRNVMLPTDPDEIVRIGDAASLKPESGAYSVVITDEFREVLYLDEAKLIAVDHPRDVEVQPTDKLMPAPFPTSEVWALAGLRRPRSVIGDDGIDRTRAVGAIDDEFAPPGVALPAPFRGMTHPLAITMDFGSLDADKPLVLALTGWLQYGDGSTNIALSQSSTVTVIPPMLDVEAGDGAWLPIDMTVGMPAGKTKTILCDLTGRLPRGARRLRLTTTFEIRWDRIALSERVALPAERVHTIAPRSAELQWRGFSELKGRVPGGPTTPDFDVVSDRPRWRTSLTGWCGRYGDAMELVTDRDDKLALVNAGDALTIRFDAASLPPVPPEMVRTLFLYTVGWDKDGDLNVVGGDRVEPLPVGLPAAAPASRIEWPDESDWRLRYNTRFVPRDRFAPDR